MIRLCQVFAAIVAAVPAIVGAGYLLVCLVAVYRGDHQVSEGAGLVIPMAFYAGGAALAISFPLIFCTIGL